MKSCVIVCLLFASSQASIFDWFSGSNPAWNGLKAGFGINPFTAFQSLPRTASDAVDAGWEMDTTAGSCASPGKYNGNRYRKNGEQATMLLFDKNGVIAGIQAGIPKTDATYPAPNNAKYHVFNEEKDMWVVTAYFTDPSTVCTTGRSHEEFITQGTGTMLAIQIGKNASHLLHVPIDETKVESSTPFVQGKCFYSMGMHYWYNISKDMDCKETFPVFLLYNKGKLNGFGWAFNPNFSNSGKWEHPTKTVFGAFMKEPPTCLGKDGPVTTLHVYMTNSPVSNFC